jgi:hypothetical protein
LSRAAGRDLPFAADLSLSIALRPPALQLPGLSASKNRSSLVFVAKSTAAGGGYIGGLLNGSPAWHARWPALSHSPLT